MLVSGVEALITEQVASRQIVAQGEDPATVYKLYKIEGRSEAVCLTYLSQCIGCSACDDEAFWNLNTLAVCSVRREDGGKDTWYVLWRRKVPDGERDSEAWKAGGQKGKGARKGAKGQRGKGAQQGRASCTADTKSVERPQGRQQA